MEIGAESKMNSSMKLVPDWGEVPLEYIDLTRRRPATLTKTSRPHATGLLRLETTLFFSVETATNARERQTTRGGSKPQSSLPQTVQHTRTSWPALAHPRNRPGGGEGVVPVGQAQRRPRPLVPSHEVPGPRPGGADDLPELGGLAERVGPPVAEAVEGQHLWWFFSAAVRAAMGSLIAHGDGQSIPFREGFVRSVQRRTVKL